MKCQICGKREATVIYTHIVEDQKKVVYLCAQCGAAHQIGHDSQAGQVDVEEIPTRPIDTAVGTACDQEKGTAHVRCSDCGLTYEEFRKRGRAGCSQCYTAFAEPLERLLRRLHGADRHRGKGLVRREGTRIRAAGLEELRQALQAAVASEAYEQAAQLRDRIRELEEISGDRDGTGEDLEGMPT